MGKAALDAAPEIANIKLTMANLHHLLADLTPFGQDNPNHIFVPIDEPTLATSKPPSSANEIRQVLRRIDIHLAPSELERHHRARRLLDDRSPPLVPAKRMQTGKRLRGNTAGTPEIPA